MSLIIFRDEYEKIKMRGEQWPPLWFSGRSMIIERPFLWKITKFFKKVFTGRIK